MRRGRRISGAACKTGLVCLVLAGCASGLNDRSTDGLLEREDLQRVVDRALERDVPALIEALSAADAAVRRRAALGLAGARDPSSRGALLRGLSDPDRDVREAVAFALGQLHDPALAPDLLGALAGESQEPVARRLLDALGQSGGRGALDGLLALAPERSRLAAYQLALGRLAVQGMATPESFQRLLAGLTNVDPSVRESSAWAFGRLVSAAPWRAWVADVRNALDGYGPDDPAAGPLLTGLSRVSDPSDTPRMLFWLQQASDWRLRYLTAVGLTPRVDDPRVREALFVAIDDESPHVGEAAATAVSTLAAPSDEDLARMEAALTAHAGDLHRAFPLLAAFSTRDRSQRVRSWLAEYGDDGPEQRSTGLAALALDPGEVGFAAVLEALDAGGAMADRAFDALGNRWSVDRRDPARLERLRPRLIDALDSGRRMAVVGAATLLADSALHGGDADEALARVARGLDPVDRAIELSAVLEALEARGVPAPSGLAPQLPARRALDWAAARRWGRQPRLRLETERGEIILRLDMEAAPLTVESMATLAAQGALDGTPFHRVVPVFVAQGGDVSGGDGLGGPGYRIRTEPGLRPFLRGSAGMASAGPDTEGSQFFLMQGSAPHLDGAYTVFGEVVAGMDVVDRLQVGDRILQATVEPGA
ncbi:MAG: peptidylprolyl isomerase [Gemmatimonadota bacterium]